MYTQDHLQAYITHQENAVTHVIANFEMADGRRTLAFTEPVYYTGATGEAKKNLALDIQAKLNLLEKRYHTKMRFLGYTA